MTAVQPTDSTGAKGHPESCAPPCKYYWKERGCKDGASCTRCHRCPWKRPHVQDSRETKENEGGGSDEDSYSDDVQAEEGGGKGSGKKATNHSPAAIAKYEKLASNNEKYAHMSDEELLAILPKKADGGLTSIGAMLHESDMCSQCVFTQRDAGCTNAIRCKFCHHDHVPKERKRTKTRKRAGGAGGEGGGGGDAKRARTGDNNGSDNVELDASGNSRPSWLRGDDSDIYGKPRHGAGYSPHGAPPHAGYPPHPGFSGYYSAPAYPGYPPHPGYSI